ncbi:Ribosomal RNA small subunit methyltransferase C [Raoultella terrigena]|uniref:Ribosomal RNA small subunit methyltransferase C n=1 Tax=Raoultella terrigena TaxID=577 RepID=A0A4U9DCQ5_RAOTE|nr:Ribosomal RNA small subunit methyltransferase C [Raoultella terrigena]
MGCITVVWKKQPTFDPEQYWGEYPLDNLTIKTLPGVFSRDGLDVGSQLLLSTLTPHTKGKVLDVGCGAGVLATVLASHSPKGPFNSL